MLLCHIGDINSKSRGNSLASNRRNSVPCIVRTSRQGSCNQRVGCLQYDLEPLDLLNGLAVGCYQPSPEVFFVLVFIGPALA